MGLLDNIFDKDGKDAKAKPASPASAPRADFSDVRGASETTTSADAPASRTYTVVAGDSLSKIAQRELGDASRWRAIHEANRDTIKDPDLIHPGQVLKIPATS